MNQKISARLAPRPSLEHLKHQAKSLLKSAREGNVHALSRLVRAKALPENPVARQPLRLADAQLAIARENGASTWMELRAALEQAVAAPPSAEAIPAISGLDQVWLDCTDLEKTAQFYGGLLGLKPTGAVPGAMLFYDCGGTTLLLGLRQEVRPNSVLYFRLPGSERVLQDAYNRLKAAGVAMGDSPHCIARNWQGTDVWLAFFSDPAGNQLAFKVGIPAGEKGP